MSRGPYGSVLIICLCRGKVLRYLLILKCANEGYYLENKVRGGAKWQVYCAVCLLGKVVLMGNVS